MLLYSTPQFCQYWKARLDKKDCRLFIKVEANYFYFHNVVAKKKSFLHLYPESRFPSWISTHPRVFRVRVVEAGKGELSAFLFACGDAKRNRGITQFANWAMHSPPGCAILIQLPPTPKAKEKSPERGSFLLVEVGGVEPPSESTLTGTSPGADGCLHSLVRAGAVTLGDLVAS